MDNASYYKSRPLGTPIPNKMKKLDKLNFLDQRSIEYPVDVTAIEARVMLRDYICGNIQIDVVQAADRHGHEVVFTPPHYSDLQPIELIWAHIKGNIARKYSLETNLTAVKQRLDEEFEKLNSSEGGLLVQRIMSHVDDRIK